MPSRFRQWTLDVHDVQLMAAFWSQALGYRIEPAQDGSAHLRPPADSHDLLDVWLQPTDAKKKDKNRNHPDLIVEGGDITTEVERLLSLGATHSDVGQTGTERFTVLADPEGNEFCLLHSAPF